MLPKITVITPVLNQIGFIERTILSVISQNYPNLEYIVVDGGSTDGTLEVLNRYREHYHYFISESDNGMYDALQKGFEQSSGEIMTYINSDDLLLKNSLKNMAQIFEDLPSVSWVQGLNSFIDLEDNITLSRYGKKFSLLRFLDRDYKYIQQESTFWRRNLWNRAGGYINSDLSFAGDFELWFRFSQHAKLYNSNVPIGAWRKRDGQLSESNLNAYFNEVESIIGQFDLKANHIAKLRRIQILRKWHYRTKKYLKIKTAIFQSLIYKTYDVDSVDIQIDKKTKRYYLRN